MRPSWAARQIPLSPKLDESRRSSQAGLSSPEGFVDLLEDLDGTEDFGFLLGRPGADEAVERVPDGVQGLGARRRLAFGRGSGHRHVQCRKATAGRAQRTISFR